MRTGRKWTFLTAGVAALSFGADAADPKQGQLFPKLHDLKPVWAGPDFRGMTPGAAGSSLRAIPGLNAGQGPGASAGASLRGSDAPAIGNSGGRTSSIDRAAMPDKPSQHGKPQGKGKDEPDQPGENVQASAGHAANAIGRQRKLHDIPTCF